MLKNPRRIAANDAPGKLLMNASTPCMKSRLSYSNAAVASDGAPSSNSNVPRRVSTRSGVEIDLNVSDETPPCTTSLISHTSGWVSHREVRRHHPASPTTRLWFPGPARASSSRVSERVYHGDALPVARQGPP